MSTLLKEKDFANSPSESNLKCRKQGAKKEIKGEKDRKKQSQVP